MAENKIRIYKYDNVKALLIFMVVVGHLTTDYVTEYYSVRWITLWIYTFHMPAFIFISGLMHKHYITTGQAELGIKGHTSIRRGKIIGFLLCAYALKFFLQIFRTAIGQHPYFYWLREPGIPWYLIVMAEYEIILYAIRKVDAKAALIASFALSAAFGYLNIDGDMFCVARMVNFLPIFLTGYYLDTDRLTEFSEKTKVKLAAWVIVVVSLAVCCFGDWSWYSIRKWFTGRRSYEFLQDYFPGTLPYCWAIRLGIWAIALILTLAIVIVIPDRNMRMVSLIGANTLNVYFWHRPICYLINQLGLFPAMVDFCGTGDWSIALALTLFVLFGAALTIIFGQNIFAHPCKELVKLGDKIENCTRMGDRRENAR